MRGPYLLRPLQVDMSVPVRVGGVYCLARNPREVVHIGRSDRDLRDKIKSYWPEYQFFWYETAITVRDAFLNHCVAFHRHSETDLETSDHPKPPGALPLKCPVCGV